MLPSKTDNPPAIDLTRKTTAIVTAFLKGNKIGGNEIPHAIRSVFSSLSGIAVADRVRKTQKPAVPIAKSVKPDGIICLEDGRKLKVLKRHLRTCYGLSPDQYRKKWGLPDDYPMVAPDYARDRSAFAKKIGLGRKVK